MKKITKGDEMKKITKGDGMKKIGFISCIILLAAGGACADVLFASADAMIDGGDTDTNFGAATQLFLRGGGGANTEKLYYQFDVEGILGSGEVFDGVEFSIATHPNQPVNATGFNWTLHGITDNNDSWTESGITWDNAPKNDTSGTGVVSGGTTNLANFTFASVPAGTATYTISGAGLDEYLNWKAGAIADPYGNGAADNTVATIIVTANNSSLGRILSKEGTGVNDPQLSYTVIPEPATIGLFSVCAGLLLVSRRLLL
ncbi:DNRLRE domain-containing protein [Kiritimatiella glycovorans]|uniref:Carbohydrate-binding module family 96 domain-containing protein n=1 Tax=Kiritimatiella glycovorans TaxID=1307763 RepID=A0A0G3EJK2_9BACT|nr:DNRLRE domain-containing protein [Kiritimatiella glycovorans]AKJ65627.1 hypothetical protein L21SP4_02402 [Kiritimatiella glycovorans]